MSFIPQPEDLGPLQSYTREQFKDWLLTGLRNFPAQNRHAFGLPAQTFIGLAFSVGCDLANIHSALKPPAQKEFQEALLLAMRDVLECPGKDKADDERVIEELAYVRSHGTWLGDDPQRPLYPTIALRFPELQQRYGIPKLSRT